MRTIHRDIVGGFIFSDDGKLLLGQNRSRRRTPKVTKLQTEEATK